MILSEITSCGEAINHFYIFWNSYMQPYTYYPFSLIMSSNIIFHILLIKYVTTTNYSWHIHQLFSLFIVLYYVLSKGFVFASTVEKNIIVLFKEYMLEERKFNLIFLRWKKIFFNIQRHTCQNCSFHKHVKTHTSHSDYNTFYRFAVKCHFY